MSFLKLKVKEFEGGKLAALGRWEIVDP